VTLRPSAERFRTDQAGITSWHSLSAGQHYDPSNLAFGSVVGLDEHLMAPGAGFDWHGHRGIVIVSRVLAGVLRHEDAGGRVLLVGPGELLVQAAGDGIRHSERNASATEPLRFLQLTLLGEAEVPDVRVVKPPLILEVATVSLAVRFDGAGPALVHDAASGDALRLAASEHGRLHGDLLVITFP
jgi:redox-sensitive bicupin YhaK (pirin superfamily)